jgi:hypothetical protein
MRDPFQIEGPALISFSGGRTSGYMLRRILDAHGGTLPADVHVLFANTGKEREETLQFVWECSERWGVRAHWVEWRPGEKTARRRSGVGDAFSEVDFDTATRDRPGEWTPLQGVLERRAATVGQSGDARLLPNRDNRFCSNETKIIPMGLWMRAHGYDHWTAVIGMRADEERRVRKVRGIIENLNLSLEFEDLAPLPEKKTHRRERWDSEYPLHEAGIRKPQVTAWWAGQPFNLDLEDHEGNCDLCFQKRSRSRVAIIRKEPERVEWWRGWEHRSGVPFRRDAPNYDQLLSIALHPELEIDLSEDDGSDCFCGVG